ncbi:MAG: aspartyl/asparaginyl beta-hydroxylase domain-containing protein [Bacteroidia bacterium]
MELLSKLLWKKNNELRKPYGYDVPVFIQDFHNNIDKIILEWQNYTLATSSIGVPIDEFSDYQKELNKDKKWKAFFVFIFGELNPDAATYFPLTSMLGEKWKNDIKLIFFSNLEPGSHLAAHRGNNHSVIRVQLGIDIKQPQSTGLRVADKIIQLKNKELFIFDDTFEHEAWNTGKDVRTVLIIDYKKKFPPLYDLINRYMLKKMKETPYVQSVLAKLKNRN